MTTPLPGRRRPLLLGLGGAVALAWGGLLLLPALQRATSRDQLLALQERLAPPAAAGQAREAAPAPPLAAALPMGVYWPGEYLQTDPANRRRIDWAEVERSLDDLAARHVTAIWLTHRTAAQTADFARRAGRRGIRVVASIAQLAGEVPQVRRGDHPRLIRDTLAAWGDAPRPLAWGLGDEPRTAYMNEMAAYVAAWRRQAPREPLTTVVMHRDVPAAAQVGFDALTTDVYPFFSRDNPNAYAGSKRRVWISNVDRLRRLSPVPWMMGQAYQEPWGPIRLSPQGTIIYEPGSAPHWEMPTPPQVRWQTLAAVARGARGMFYFAYRVAPSPKLRRLPGASLPARVSRSTDSGSPMGLVHLDGRPTAQLRAMGEAFGWVARHRPILAAVRLAPAAEQPLAPDALASGHVASVFVRPSDGACFLMVVASYNPQKINGVAQAGPTPVPVLLGPQVTALRSLDGSAATPLAAGPRGQRTSVRLAPGTAALFALSVDRARLPRP